MGAVVADAADEFGMVFFCLFRLSKIPVGVGPFPAVVVIGSEVELLGVRGVVYRSHASTTGLHSVGILPGSGVFVESASAFIIASYGEGHLVVRPVIVGQGHVVVVVAGGITQFDVRSLIEERVAGMYAYDSSHGIPSVERSLRSPQNINAFDVVEVEVVGRFVGIGDVVDVQCHSRCVDAAADATQIYGRCDAASVVRNEEVGDNGAGTFDACDVACRHDVLADEAHGSRLLAQASGFFGSRHHRHFVEGNGVQAIVGSGGEKRCKEECKEHVGIGVLVSVCAEGGAMEATTCVWGEGVHQPFAGAKERNFLYTRNPYF